MPPPATPLLTNMGLVASERFRPISVSIRRINHLGPRAFIETSKKISRRLPLRSCWRMPYLSSGHRNSERRRLTPEAQVFPVPGKRDLALNRPWSTPGPNPTGLSGQACFGHLPGWSSAGKDHDSIHLSIAGEINTDPGEFRAPADSEFGPGARWTGASGGRPGYHVFY